MPSLVIQPAMSTSNDALSKRRRFQPVITSFFQSQQPESHIVDGTPVSHNHYAAATYSAMPVVSEKVQSSLLSVGMRVRKSVADGYKTQRSLKQEKSIPPPLAVKTPTAELNADMYSHGELAPFSGISKYNQSFSSTSGHIVNDDGDDYSLSHRAVKTLQKRIFGSDDFAAWEDESNIAFHDAPTGQQRRRMLALRQTSQPGMDVDDFEEASFLRPLEEADADYARMDWA
ncbi:hypothetical protein N7509_011704 [Penicillium cosmopolitanum]|uniref:Uncharacterized protein n=1 Tax=Penicillium cosmopolitanum TaxID=1131564 RepID=A0A9W9SIF8_9EURO|nr:uncharacterized protein N7509_011704 [Penicillium cosmopolitanum]KAJ5378585.1 hypothetical protein N7509_011704 [Penicillium cosmopolitanum]